MNHSFSALLDRLSEPALVIERLLSLSAGVRRLAGPSAGFGGEIMPSAAPSAAEVADTFVPSGQVYLRAG